MSRFSYADAPHAIRDDIPAAHRRAWQRLAEAGTWWTGSERVAIAAEARNAAACPLCRERKAALSPNAVSGEHADLGALSGVAVDVIHRVVTDPGRLSRAWYEKSLADGLSDAHYVEIVGVVVTLMSIDAFHRALGIALEPLPEPQPGAPSQQRPAGAAMEAAWVPMIAHGRESGPDADVYEGAKTANVIRALSLVPDEVRVLKDLSAAHYLPFSEVENVRSGRTLSRAQMELLAGRISALNECFY